MSPNNNRCGQFVAACAISLMASLTQAAPDIVYQYGGMPDIAWSNNYAGPLFYSQPRPGGIYRQARPELPTHIRRFGPDSDNYLAAVLNQLQMPLLGQHPEDESLISMLCSDWHTDSAANTFYCRLDSEARWSDGVSVTTEDIVFTFEFLSNPSTKSKHQRDAIASIIEQVNIFSERVFSISSKQPLTNSLRRLIDMRPLAKHFYTARRGWPATFNVLGEPSTGPYYIENLSNQSRIAFRKTTNWWAANRPFFVNRFNVSRVMFIRAKSATEVVERFRSGELDAVAINRPSNWHSQAIRTLNADNKIALLEFTSDHGVSRYAAWQWLQLPPTMATRETTDVLDPFSLNHGGGFWINQEARIDILARPRRSDAKPLIISNRPDD